MKISQPCRTHNSEWGMYERYNRKIVANVFHYYLPLG